MRTDQCNRFAHRDPMQLMMDQCIAGQQCFIVDAADLPVGTQLLSHRSSGEQRGTIVRQW